MNKFLSLILILTISSCSSIAFWQSDEVDLDEPCLLYTSDAADDC